MYYISYICSPLYVRQYSLEIPNYFSGTNAAYKRCTKQQSHGSIFKPKILMASQFLPIWMY